jgi:hypothetical protein
MAGELMTWVSGQQVADRLTSQDVSDAYTACKVTITDMFPPNDPAVIAAHIANVFAVLSAKVAASE